MVILNQLDQLENWCAIGSADDIVAFATDNDANLLFTKDGYTVLQSVVKSGRKDSIEVIANLLDSNKWDVDCVSLADGDTLLHTSVETANEISAIKFVMLVLAKNADPNVRNKKLRTPYDCALGRGFYDVAGILDGSLEGHATLERRIQDDGIKYGKRLIQSVRRSDARTLTDCLLLGADPNYLDTHGAGSIHYLITHSTLPTLSILQELHDWRANLDLRDEEGDTVLNLVIKTSRLRADNQMYHIVDWLLTNGASTTFADLDGNKAVDLALAREYYDVVGLLEGQRANDVSPVRVVSPVRIVPPVRVISPLPMAPRSPTPHQQEKPDERGWYQIHHAACLPSEEERTLKIEGLLSSGSDVDARNNEGDTALHLAAQKGYKDTVTQLLQHGISQDLCNGEGRTAYDLAVEYGHIDVSDVLRPQKLPDKKSRKCTIS